MAKKNKKSLDLFPVTVFVTRDEDSGGDTYLMVDEDFSSLDNAVTVGVYELVEVKTVRVTTDLVSV